ncbi:hypothetical protein HAX54_022101, partial [Datura stramonium]|nr:hypothetical protein [Datura stramonium]
VVAPVGGVIREIQAIKFVLQGPYDFDTLIRNLGGQVTFLIMLTMASSLEYFDLLELHVIPV